jgi:hypothetical protein
LVAKKAHAGDGRSYEVSLTTTGWAVKKTAGAAVDRALNELLARMDDDPAELVAMLDRLRFAAQEAIEAVSEHRDPTADPPHADGKAAAGRAAILENGRDAM